MIPHYILIGIIVGIIIAVTIYIADRGFPYIAGLISAIPLSLATIILINKNERSKFIETFTIGIILYAFFAILLYYFSIIKNYDQQKTIIFCCIGWIIITAIIFIYYYKGN
jgi:hypothetical protein